MLTFYQGQGGFRSCIWLPGAAPGKLPVKTLVTFHCVVTHQGRAGLPENLHVLTVCTPHEVHESGLQVQMQEDHVYREGPPGDAEAGTQGCLP